MSYRRSTRRHSNRRFKEFKRGSGLGALLASFGTLDWRTKATAKDFETLPVGSLVSIESMKELRCSGGVAEKGTRFCVLQRSAAARFAECLTSSGFVCAEGHRSRSGKLLLRKSSFVLRARCVFQAIEEGGINGTYHGYAKTQDK